MIKKEKIDFGKLIETIIDNSIIIGAIVFYMLSKQPNFIKYSLIIMLAFYSQEEILIEKIFRQTSLKDIP